MKTKQKVLFIGDGVIPTGFSRVMHAIANRLKHKYDIHHLALNWPGESPPHIEGYKIYPMGLAEEVNIGEEIIPIVKRVEPRLVFILDDIGCIGYYMRYLNMCNERKRFKVIVYCPIDAEYIKPRHLELIVDVDRFVVYTKFAKNVLENAMRVKGLSFHSSSACDVIPHGVDTQAFRPNQPSISDRISDVEKRQAILSLFNDSHDLKNPFVVLNANRNQPRKRIDITIKGFSLFAKDKPQNVKLFLHMGPNDRGWDIIEMAELYGIKDRLILPCQHGVLPNVDDGMLNQIYNLCDVGINTSHSEGWGLVSFEHAAAGAAQIVPRHTACAELWENHAYMLEPVIGLTEPGSVLEQQYVSPHDVAQALHALYVNPDVLAEYAIKGHENALREEYQWERIANRWNEIFRDVIGE